MNRKQIAKQLIELAEQLVERYLDPALLQGMPYDGLGHNTGDIAWVFVREDGSLQQAVPKGAETHDSLWPYLVSSTTHWLGRYDKNQKVVTIYAPQEHMRDTVPAVIMSKLENAFPETHQFLLWTSGNRWVEV